MRTVKTNEVKDKKWNGWDFEDRENWKENRLRKNDTAPKLQYKNYTPLFESRSHILATIERTDLLKFRKETDRPMGKDSDAYCKFHKMYRHNTNWFRDLKNQIESLIRNGRLQRYVQAEKKDRRRHEDKVDIRKICVNERK